MVMCSTSELFVESHTQTAEPTLIMGASCFKEIVVWRPSEILTCACWLALSNTDPFQIYVINNICTLQYRNINKMVDNYRSVHKSTDIGNHLVNE